jgi:hypothetical protein
LRLEGITTAINWVPNVAFRLFKVKVLPTLTYGLQIIWDHLSVKQLESIESLKARYLKRTKGQYTPSRLVYPLARETFLLDDLMLKHLLPRTSEVKAVLRSRKKKQEEFWQDLYATEAMITESLKEENQEIRHLVTRLAVHGFHTRVCINKSTTSQTATVIVNCVAGNVGNIIYRCVQKG